MHRRSQSEFLRDLARRLTLLDRIALGLAALYAVGRAARYYGHEPPFAGLLAFLLYLSIGYFVYRVGAWGRSRLLWSLRNRLIIAYVFIAVVPVVMLLVLFALSARILYSQLGGYLFFEDMQRRVQAVADAADTVAAAASMFSPNALKGSHAASELPPALEAHIATLEADLPALEFDLHADGRHIQEAGAERTGRFAGILQDSDGLWVVGEVKRGNVIVTARAPVGRIMLEGVAPFLGPVQVVPTRPASISDPSASLLHIGDSSYRLLDRVETRDRKLDPAKAWYDFQIDGVSKLDSLVEDSAARKLVPSPVFVYYTARPSALNSRLFSSLGELSSFYINLFLVVVLFFLVLEAGALVTGIVLTRTITRSVGELYEATQYVRAGDFSRRIRIERADQLGALAESFNAMAASVDTLIEEQKQRQRLENEVSIAQEVQAQLFPRTLPVLPGIELGAFCRPARGVSGDYYDFLSLGNGRLAIALADISGKGISAALLMASVQAALRSQVLLDGNASPGAGEIVRRINRHLFLNTAEDRFATFFFAIYDSNTRILQYTNAGHLPPMCIEGEKIVRLEAGGTVVGVFEDSVYEEGRIEVKSDAILVAYSDGLVEPENVYGEEFGVERLEAVALRHRQSNADAMVAALLNAPEEWAGSAEQADDMTVIVARLSGPAR